MVQPHVPRLCSGLRRKFPGFVFSSIQAGGKSPLSTPRQTVEPPPTAQVILMTLSLFDFTAPSLFFPKAQGDPGQTTNSSADSPGESPSHTQAGIFSESVWASPYVS